MDWILASTCKIEKNTAISDWNLRRGFTVFFSGNRQEELTTVPGYAQLTVLQEMHVSLLLFLFTMEELEIKLKYDPQHFRELYYKNGEGSVFTARGTKKPIWVIIFFIAATIIIYALSFRFERLSLFIIYAIMATIGVTIYAYESVNFYMKWKKDIESYLKDMSKY
ncbi:MAG TPA: hypothetical protein VIZ28_19635, partial [Chitinophagaceae bacterium]